jgi:hypothetical protein
MYTFSKIQILGTASLPMSSFCVMLTQVMLYLSSIHRASLKVMLPQVMTYLASLPRASLKVMPTLANKFYYSGYKPLLSTPRHYKCRTACVFRYSPESFRDSYPHLWYFNWAALSAWRSQAEVLGGMLLPHLRKVPAP